MFVFECHTNSRDCLIMFLGQYVDSSKRRLIGDIQNAYKNNLTPELVLFVYPAYLDKEVSALLQSENVIIDLTRQKYSPVICLSFDEHSVLSIEEVFSDSGNKSIELDLDALLPDIIKSGYEYLMDKRSKDVLVKAPSGTTFVKPSGKNLEEFIYASQLARNSFEYQFLAMSILAHAPPLDRIDAIYIDTASISSIAESVIYYITRFRGGSCKHLTYRSFSSYTGLEENIKPDNTEGAWVIISASASTSMGKKLVNDWKIDSNQVLTILSYNALLNKKNNIGDDVVFCLNDYSNRDRGSFSPIKVQVQGESFSAEVSVPNKVALLKKYKPKYIDDSIYPFYNSKTFSVNRDGYTLYVDYSELRNNFIDDKNILSSEKDLYKWMKQIVEWSLPKNLSAIISPRDTASRTLLSDFKYVLEKCGVDLKNIKDIDPEEQDKMDEVGDSAVLILSPVVSSAHVFVDINRALRLAKHSGMRVFATPFAVSPCLAQSKNIYTSLTQGTNGFKYSYLKFKTMFLSSKNLSPWDKEIEVVRTLINNCDDSAADFWLHRKNLLEKNGVGLMNSVGIHYSDPNGFLNLMPDFVFWPATYKHKDINLSAVFATVGAIFQNLRENEIDGCMLSANIYQHSVLDPENFVRFNDPILQSCLWRCALPVVLDYRRSDALSSDIQCILSKIFKSSNSSRGVTSLDLLMALATRWIKISSVEMKAVINSAENYLIEPHAKLLVQYMKTEFLER